MAETLWCVGDVQGHLEPFRRVLHDVGLVDVNDRWSGASAGLAVAGDLVDRGPDGVGVIELLMRLDAEARQCGGRVHVVLGNHDVFLLAVHRFAELVPEWQATGGVPADLERLTGAQVAWLEQLPALLLLDGVLLAHADAIFYREYGASVEEVNHGIRDVLQSEAVEPWRRLLDQFSEHRTFFAPGGCEKLDEFLQTFGARRLVHGHSPIARTLQVPPESVTEAYVYCAGRAVNVDPGLYLGGRGFAFLQRSDDTFP